MSMNIVIITLHLSLELRCRMILRSLVRLVNHRVVECKLIGRISGWSSSGVPFPCD